MKKNIDKLVMFSLLLSGNLFALDLNQAIDTALKNNLSIKSSDYDYIQSLNSQKIAKSAFMPRVDAKYNYANTNKPNPMQEDESASFSLGASINLFNGFKDISNKNSAKYLSQASKYSLEAKKFDTILDVKKAYINYLVAQSSLKTYNSSYKLYQKQYEDSKNRYDQGLIAKNDLLKVQVLSSVAKQNIESAKGELIKSKQLLSNYLGGMDLSSENIEEISDSDLIIRDYKKEDLSNRSEIQALNMSLNSIKEQEKSIQSAYYPKLNASYSYNRYFDTLGFSPINEPARKHQNIAGLSATWNLYNGNYDDAQKQIKKTEYLKTKNQLEDTKLKINLQYETAKANLNVALQNLSTAELSLLQAKENYNIEKNRFDEGIATSTELTDANYLLTQAKQNYNKAYYNKYLTISTLDRIFEYDKQLEKK